MKPSIYFIKIRDVKTPTRGEDMYGNAGIDFFVPNDLTFEDIEKANEKTPIDIVRDWIDPKDHLPLVAVDPKGMIILSPHSRIIIPTGIKAIINPVNSMLQANNKSGVATKLGLVVGATIVDSNYTGEIHISVINTSSTYVDITPGQKLVQFIHTPVYLTEPKEIDIDNFLVQAERRTKKCGRGENWQGSTDTK